jgi:hypothetical protein
MDKINRQKNRTNEAVYILIITMLFLVSMKSLSIINIPIELILFFTISPILFLLFTNKIAK